MVKIDKYIGELLYDHECVIVPELGGFLSSYVPSRIQPSQHLVLPPSKKIAFNVYLRQNDGLLANHLVQAESVTYPEAVREIEGYVRQCYSELGEGKKFVIDRVGVLSRDTETNLQFEPFTHVNYLKDSYGLPAVQYIPVLTSEFEQEVEKQLRDFISLRPSQAQSRAPLYRKKTKLNALNSMLLTGSVLWLCLNLYIVSPTRMNFATLNPFAVAPESTFISEPPASSKGEIYTQPGVSIPETVNVNSSKPIVSEKAELTPAQKLEEAISTNTSNSYYIIAGAFTNLSNADRKAAELRKEGFADARVIEDTDGLNLVCYNGFASRKDALEELKNLKSRNKEGWIFSR